MRWVDGAGAREEVGLRASPVVSLQNQVLRLTATIEQFWQNFPKAVEASAGTLRLRLFPLEFGEPFELLGGEQKTHHVWFAVEPVGKLARPVGSLGCVHAPLTLRLSGDGYVGTGVLPRVIAAHRDTPDFYGALIREGLEGRASFFAKREVIDEYGWRHFGDVYADHENEYYAGSSPVVSHYNNQYDLILGFLIAFLRSGDQRWFQLASDLARHVMDIDVYRTREDRPGYNGGLFWHTDHYQDAHRSGHRSYSKHSPRAREGRTYGGGPSNEHNYTSGLLLYHYLTGCPMARETVLSLAHWVLDMDDGTKTPLGVIDPGPTGLASATRSPDYHGPGRGAGNSINALLDAFSLTGERLYLDKAEEFIARCIHPRDDIVARRLADIEGRWSYLVFLQVLGKYLDLKFDLGERDRKLRYARESLLAYARWMLIHEIPYAMCLDRVEYPTETWLAQDLRKSVVFGYAAAYSDATLRDAFLEASETYYRESIGRLTTFETRTCTRPLAIVLQNGALLDWRVTAAMIAPFEALDDDYGNPGRFAPQRDRVARLLCSRRGLIVLLKLFLDPVRARSLVTLLFAEASRRWW
jgi:hypothetical protein